MIRHDRDRLDAAGGAILPRGTWTQRATAATVKLQNAGSFKPVESLAEGIYSDDEARRALEELFHEKCAYCEIKITGAFYWHVEHFRPKGNVHEAPNHGGYYWLACTWENLYTACQFCNIATKDRGTYNHPGVGLTAGKLDQFPLRSEANRMLSAGGQFAAEESDRLLLDPCRDDTENELGFDGTGSAIALNGSDRAEKTIEVLHLNRSDRIEARVAHIAHIVAAIQTAMTVVPAGVAWADVRDKFLNLYGATHQPYAGVARSMQRDPAAFGILTQP